MIEKYWRNYKWQSSSGYYNIHLQHNLLGHWSVISCWGKNVKKTSNIKIKFFYTLRGALDYIYSLNKGREKYHYRLLGMY